MENERFLVVEKEVKVVNKVIEDFILDIPLTQEVKSIVGLLISATSEQLKYDLKWDTRCPFFSSEFGYTDFIAKTNPNHPQFNANFADLLYGVSVEDWNLSSVVGYRLKTSVYLRYASIMCITDEYRNIINNINLDNTILVGDESGLEEITLLTFWGNFATQIKNLLLRPYLLNKYYEDNAVGSIVNDYHSFSTFFDINFFSHLIDLSSKIPFSFDYGRYFAGTMSIALNGEHLLLRNTRLTLNQANKNLQNNLIELGNIESNNGFLRCTYFSKNHNLFENIGYGRSILKGGMLFPYYKLSVRNFKMKVKIYVKYIKNE